MEVGGQVPVVLTPGIILQISFRFEQEELQTRWQR